MENLPLSSRTKRLTRSQSRLKQNNFTYEEDKKVEILSEKLNNVSLENCKVNNKLNSTKNTLLVNNTKCSHKTLVGREKEITALRAFITDHFHNFTSGNLYISGSPGTGKTLVVTDVLEDLTSKDLCKFYFINCMDFSNPAAVYREILLNFTSKQITNTTKAADEVEHYLKSRQHDKKPIVLVLDEVDQLLLRSKSILYKILSWIEISSSRIVIIGIANSLDLTERMLPDLLLQSYRPHHMNFRPYTEDEIASIIMTRVETELTPVEQQAVKFCSKKISAKSGDARAALDLYKRAVELSELEELAAMRSESVDTIAGETEFPTSPMRRVFSTPKLLARKMSQKPIPNSPSIKHVNRAIKEVERGADPFRNIINTESGKSTLPLHQKLGLCAGLILSKQKLKKPIRIAQLYDKYDEVCKSQNIEPIDISNFIDCIVHLDSRGLVRIQPHKESRQRVFTMNLDENGIEKALDDKALLSSILNRFMLD